jgi:hypothetical protein
VRRYNIINPRFCSVLAVRTKEERATQRGESNHVRYRDNARQSAKKGQDERVDHRVVRLLDAEAGGVRPEDYR